MAPEDRLRQSVDAAVEGLRARVEDDLRGVIRQILTTADEERERAVRAARDEAMADVESEIARAIADADARVQAMLRDAVEAARRDEREKTAREVRLLVEAEAERRLNEALGTAEQRLKLAVADAELEGIRQARETAAAAHIGEREAELAGVTRLLDSVRGLDGAASLSEVLDALGRAVAREAPRSALLVLRGERVIGWTLHGFGPRDAQPKAIDMPLGEAGAIGLAVGTARTVTTKDSETASGGPGFTELPPDRMGLAVPVLVGGRVVAVVYADGVSHGDREAAVPSAWPEVIEVLARHAARCLEALTVQRAAAQPSPRFWVPPGAAPAPREDSASAGGGASSMVGT